MTFCLAEQIDDLGERGAVNRLVRPLGRDELVGLQQMSGGDVERIHRAYSRACRFFLAENENRLEIPGNHSAREKPLIETPSGSAPCAALRSARTFCSTSRTSSWAAISATSSGMPAASGN